MADPAMAAARGVAERTNEPIHGLDPERRPVALRHLIRNGSGSIGYRLGTPRPHWWAGSRRSLEATIQRLIAQADAQAKTVTDLAFEAWSGTQRCADCRFANAVRLGVSAYCGRCLHAIDALAAAGFGEHMREWGG